MNKKIKYSLIIMLLLLTTGCTTYIKDGDGKPVTNPTTGQNLAENILCRPTDEETVKLYEDNNYDLSKLPYCVCKNDKVKEKVKIDRYENNENDTSYVKDKVFYAVVKGNHDNSSTMLVFDVKQLTKMFDDVIIINKGFKL